MSPGTPKKVEKNFEHHVTDEQRKEFKISDFIKRQIARGMVSMRCEIWELHALLELAQKELTGGKALIEVKAPVFICGDTHGQYSDLLRIFECCGSPTKHNYLFLGSYINKGRHSLEVICLLLAFRVAVPKRMHLLRGNHELKAINKNYGFYAECQSRYRCSNWIDLYDHFNMVFSHMPLAGLVAGRILCMHGGLSPHLHTLDDIRNIELPLIAWRENPLVCDLLWADPVEKIVGFEPNKIREVGHIFGEDEVEAACKRLDIDLVVRAHQVVEYGYAFFADRRLITIFSASRYQEELHNYAAVVSVDRDLEVSFVQLKPEEFETMREERRNREYTCRGDKFGRQWERDQSRKEMTRNVRTNKWEEDQKKEKEEREKERKEKKERKERKEKERKEKKEEKKEEKDKKDKKKSKS